MTDQLDTSAFKNARVIDFETTALPGEENAKICEVGYADLNLSTREFGHSWNTLVNPDVPIPPITRAVHHISDDDVKYQMSASAALALVERDERVIFSAHNTRFEKYFFNPEGSVWIDTYRCALRAWPDAPSHSNQVLRYFLDIDSQDDFEIEKAMPPHRALPDAYVTAFILRELIKICPLWRLIEISEQPALQVKISFGQHAKKLWSEVPVSYLDWILNKSDFDDEDVLFTARHWMEKI